MREGGRHVEDGAERLVGTGEGLWYGKWKEEPAAKFTVCGH